MDSFFKDTLPHNRAFSEMLRPAKEQVKHMSPDNIAQRSGAVFHFLPNYSVWQKVWFADEEFEASGKIYISKSADCYLSMEDAVTVGEILLSKLKA